MRLSCSWLRSHADYWLDLIASQQNTRQRRAPLSRHLRSRPFQSSNSTPQSTSRMPKIASKAATEPMRLSIWSRQATMAAGAGMTLAQIDLERPGHDVCAQDVVGVALVALNGVTLDHARPVGKRERLEFGVGTASAVNPVAPSTFDIPALTLPHTVLSREKQVRRACPSPDRSRHCARTQEARQHVWPIWSRNSAPA